MIYIIILGFVALLFFCVVLLYEFNTIRKEKSIRAINVFGIMYAIIYGLINFIYAFAYVFFDFQFSRIKYDSFSLNSLFGWLIIAIVGYVLIRFVYSIEDNRKKDKIIKTAKKIRDDTTYFRLQITALICLAIGIISLYLWSRAYGGIFNLISVANYVRSGVYSVKNSLAFFKHPAKILLIVSYFSVRLIKDGYHRVFNFVLFIVSFSGSLLYLIASDGRMSMGIYFVVIFLICINAFSENINMRKKIILIFFIGIVGLFIIMKMDDFTYYLRNNEWNNSNSNSSFIVDVLQEFTFIPASGQVVMKTLYDQGSPFLVFHDIVSGLFSWVPTSLKPDNLINIWDYNTMLYLNGASSIGQVPCDFVTTSMYDLGIIGIVAFAIFWGRIIKKIDSLKKHNNSLFFEICYYSLIVSFLRMVEYCMLSDFILGLFNVFVAFIVWTFSGLLISRKQIKMGN